MVKLNQKNFSLADKTHHIPILLKEIKEYYQLDNIDLLTKASILTQQFTKGLTTFYGVSYFELGTAIAKIILDLKLDQETAAAGMLSCATSLISPTAYESIRMEMGPTISQLLLGLQQMSAISPLQNQQARHPLQIENLRNMLLAMASDIRVVIIKLAERLCMMRGIKKIASEERNRFAQETLDIYSPLANRLGIGQIKWELEDLAFRYLDPTAYKAIAHLLAERRIDRENRIQKIVTYLKEKINAANIEADILGRAKHIYSIHLKMERKNMDYSAMYDHIAVRVLVANIEDCYTVLGLVHQLYSPLTSQFDDYIAHPKANGYRSIHTTVTDEHNNYFEIQIRTHRMHEEAERGVAAHWMYKENQLPSIDTTTRISYLRQLLHWHKELIKAESFAHSTITGENKIYVITPANDILDLPEKSTPLDFAYHIHSELGHRCRGAKVNGHIVPLNHPLHTGDTIEIVTIPKGNPSRDWLNPALGYIITTRAKNKISHWFKQQALHDDVTIGKQLLERELLKHGLNKIPTLHAIAKHFNLKNEDALLAALARGHVRLTQVTQFILPQSEEKPITLPAPITKKPVKQSSGSAIIGHADILTRFAKCCKPILGDTIIGYITQGRGISIHKKECLNANRFSNINRIIDVQWDPNTILFFSTDLKIVAHDQTKILNDLAALFANEKIDLLHFNSLFNKNQNIIIITITIQVQNKAQLQQQLYHIQQLPGVIEVKRL